MLKIMLALSAWANICSICQILSILIFYDTYSSGNYIKVKVLSRSYSKLLITYYAGIMPDVFRYLYIIIIIKIKLA